MLYFDRGIVSHRVSGGIEHIRSDNASQEIVTDSVFDTALIEDFPDARPSQNEWIGFINNTNYLCSHGRCFHLSRGEEILTICENGEALYLIVNMCSTGMYMNMHEWKQLKNFVNVSGSNTT